MTPEETLLQMRSGYCTMFKVRPDINAVFDPILKHLSQIPESSHETKHSHKRYMALFHAVQQIQRRLKLTLVRKNHLANALVWACAFSSFFKIIYC